MRYFCIFCIGLVTLSFARDLPSNVADYLTFVDSERHQGNSKFGEIEILYEPELIAKAQESVKRRLIAQGYDSRKAETFSRVGIVAEDSYYIFLRDAVRFPSGHLGTYDRIIPRNSSNASSGVVSLALSPDRKIITILSYRHALRAWTIELPRGKREADELPEIAAKRELHEETGYIADETHLLGRISPDSGILSSVNSVYFIKAREKIMPNLDISEAIDSCQLFTPEELKKALTSGEIELNISGKPQRVLVIDSFIPHALVLAESLGYLPQ